MAWTASTMPPFMSKTPGPVTRPSIAAERARGERAERVHGVVVADEQHPRLAPTGRQWTCGPAALATSSGADAEPPLDQRRHRRGRRLDGRQVERRRLDLDERPQVVEQHIQVDRHGGHATAARSAATLCASRPFEDASSPASPRPGAAPSPAATRRRGASPSPGRWPPPAASPSPDPSPPPAARRSPDPSPRRAASRWPARSPRPAVPGSSASVLNIAGIGLRRCVATLACIGCRRCVACVGCIDCVDCVGCIGCVGLRGAVGRRGARA